MKKLIYVTFMLLFAVSLQAQLRLGAGFTVTPETGVTLKAQKDITDVIDGDLMLTYYFIEDIDIPAVPPLFPASSISTTLIGIDLNGHYNFEVGDGFKVYPLAGLNLGLVSVKSEVAGVSTSASDTNIGLNVGGGAVYMLGSIDIWAEGQYTIADAGDFYLRAGVMFPIGG